MGHPSLKILLIQATPVVNETPSVATEVEESNRKDKDLGVHAVIDERVGKVEEEESTTDKNIEFPVFPAVPT